MYALIGNKLRQDHEQHLKDKDNVIEGHERRIENLANELEQKAHETKELGRKLRHDYEEQLKDKEIAIKRYEERHKEGQKHLHHLQKK